MFEFNERHPDRPIDVEALRKVDPKRAKHYDPEPWGSATVRRMLRNPKYAGYVGYTPTSTSQERGRLGEVVLGVLHRRGDRQSGARGVGRHHRP